MQHNVSDLRKLLPVYALLSRIRLSSSEPVLQTAEKVIQTIVKTYPQPNLTAEQIESRATNGQDPLREFSDAPFLEGPSNVFPYGSYRNADFVCALCRRLCGGIAIAKAILVKASNERVKF
jgi:hypothetical protein